MADSIWLKILEGVQARVDSVVYSSERGDNMAYPSPDSTIIQEDFDSDYGYAFPSLLIIPGFEHKIDPLDGTNERDDYVYPVMVQIIDRKSMDYAVGAPSHLKWREQIARAINQQKLAGVPEVYIGLATSVSRVNRDLWEQHRYFVGGVEMYFKTRLTRGLTT